MRWDYRAIVAASIAVACSLLVRAANGSDTTVDPSYGRIEGDVTAVGGAGAVLGSGGVRAEAELRLRYLETAGVFGTYEDSLAAGSGVEPQRVLAVGLELRPIFLFRWLEGAETQRARLDLALDSIALELGATFSQPTGSTFASQPGIEFAVALELPLLERAAGPWIGVRGVLRWSNGLLASGQTIGPDDRQVLLALTLAWHEILSVHIVDVGDRPVR